MIHAVGGLVGWVIAHTNNRNRRIARVNLQICFPDKDNVWRHNLLERSLKENSVTMLESLWLWRHSSQVPSELCGTITNEHLLTNAGEKNKATIFVTPHFGSWEYAGLLTASRCDFMILYAPPKLRSLHELSVRGRSSTGARLIEASPAGIKTLVSHIRNGGSVGILPDQVPSGMGGVYAPFFGRMAYTTTLVGKLASRFDCEIVIGYSLRRTGSKACFDTFYYSAPKELYADEKESAISLNNLIEKFIMNAPEHYLWSYKRFKRPPAGVKNPY